MLAAAVLAGCSSPHPAPIVHRQPLPPAPPGEQVSPMVQAPEVPGEGPVVETAPVRSGAVEARPLPGAPAAGAPRPLTPGATVPGGAIRTEPSAAKLPYSAETLARLEGSAAATAAATRSEQPQPLAPGASSPGAAASESGKVVSSGGAPSARGFIWPASGPVIQGFSEPRSMGVSIAGKPGDPVVAAADGRVIFSGPGPRGYGNLMIVKHDDDTLSVYAHNRALLVKEGTNVKRGQRIAELGSSGADRPKLHFEIRRQGKPVDPSAYLPSR